MAIAADIGIGLPAFEPWLFDPSPDVRWIVRQNLGKAAGKVSDYADANTALVAAAAFGVGILVGYLMAQVDLGDFGRLEPVAIVDTIGVDPAYAHRGIGHALMSQLFVNLGALRIERAETVVAPRDCLGQRDRAR